MVQRNTMLLLLLSSSMWIFSDQTFLWARASNRQPQSSFPSAPRLQGLNGAEKAEAIEKWHKERDMQRARVGEERLKIEKREAWKRLLKITEQQWKIIEPKVEKVILLNQSAWVRGLYAISWRENRFSWYRHSEGAPLIRAKAPDEMTEGEKIADELIVLLEDPNSTDEQIKKKIDALQQFRENARKALPKAKKELAAVLTTPRQEATFLIMGYIY